MIVPWIDTTSSDKDWTCTRSGFEIRVSRRLGKWYLTAFPLYDDFPLEAEHEDTAKAKALQFVSMALHEVLSMIEKDS